MTHRYNNCVRLSANTKARILVVIKHGDGARVQTIARRIGLSVQQTGRHLNCLVESGAVSKYKWFGRWIFKEGHGRCVMRRPASIEYAGYRPAGTRGYANW